MTGKDGVPGRLAILRPVRPVRAAGDRVGHEDVLLVQSGLGEGGPQHFGACSTDERKPLDDLVSARRLTNEDDGACGIAACPYSRAELTVGAVGAPVDGGHGASVARPWP